MSTAHLTIAGVPLAVEFQANSETHAEILAVTPEDALDSILPLLAADVVNSIRVACVKQARSEREFLRRCEEQEAMEP